MNEFIYETVKTDFGTSVLKRTDADGNVLWIPVDPTNSDYAAYLASLETSSK